MSPSSDDPKQAPPDAQAGEGAPRRPDAFGSTAAISPEEEAYAESVKPPLGAGDVVAGRYRVLRYIARGGMGEVYEAEDLELGERVALKTIREEMKDKISEERFKREIQLSRKVTHPNVCRIFDVGHHHGADGKRTTFLTMELLAGTTLHERLRQGPMEIGEAAGVVRQLAAGLQAAHAAGVVHRDFKSANVMLVPRTDGEVRAVVTDFGLANVLGDRDERQRSLSGSGGIVGTPGYMAPEQVEGGELSPRTDVYALGVVMYEMVTGKLPFEGTTPLSIAAKRLTQSAPSPRLLRPELPAAWEWTIASCLQRAPAARPATPRAVVEQLESDAGKRMFPKLHQRVPIFRPMLALLLVASAVGLALRASRDRPTELGAALLSRGATLATFSAGDETGTQQCVAARIALRANLLGDFPLVESRMAITPPGEAPIVLGVEQPALGGKVALRVDGVCTLSGSGAAQQLELRLKVIDPTTSQVHAQILEHGSPLHLEEVVVHAADRLRALARLPTGQAVLLSADGRVELERAQEMLRNGELTAALELVEGAVIREPRAIELRVVHALALLGQEMEGAAAAAVARASALGPAADPFWRTRLQALASRDDSVRAAELLGQLHRDYPADLDVSLDLTMALTWAQRAPEADRLLAQLRSSRLSARDLLRTQLYAIDIKAIHSRWKEVMATLDRLRPQVEALASPGLSLAVLSSSCPADEALVDPATSESLCRELMRVARAARVPVYVENALVSFGESTRLSVIGHATVYWSERALSMARQLGSRTVLAPALDSHALRIADRGDVARGKQLLEEALVTARASHDHGLMTTVLGNLAYYSGLSGGLAEGERYTREGLELARDNDEKEQVAFGLCRLGVTQLHGGKLEAARRTLREAMDVLGDEDDLDALYQCGLLRATIAEVLGELREARAILDGLVEGERKVEDWYYVFTTSYASCALAAKQREWRTLDRCTRELDAQRDAAKELKLLTADSSTKALAWLAALGLGRPAPPAAEVEAELVALDHIKVPLRGVASTLSLCAVKRLSGAAASEILPHLDAIVAERSSVGDVKVVYEARLEKVKLLARDKKPVADDARALAAEANAMGFAWIASEAAHLAGRPPR